MSKPKVGLQLYTVRENCAKDMEGTLRKVAQMGYQGVQLTGDMAQNPHQVKSWLDENGLELAGIHVGMPDLCDRLEQVISTSITLSNPRLVCSYLPKEYQEQQGEGYRQAATIFGKAGHILADQGISLSYHNHSFEFGQEVGEYYLDILYSSVSPDYLKAELDTYWIQHGGADPAAYVAKYLNRIELLHIKDMAADENRSFAEIGQGILDWDAIFKAAEQGEIAWYLVEQDTCPGDPLISAQTSLEYLRTVGKLE